MDNMSDIYSAILEKRGLKSSHQRIKILEYLATHPCHPTAENVLYVMKAEMPTLSKSTVYKTLKAFVETGILREITIEDNEIRYEYNLKDHGHFKCTDCGEVYDFRYSFVVDEIIGLNGFKITDRNVYFKGICKKCLNK